MTATPSPQSVVVPVELLDGLRSDLANIASSLEDEGDRVYFGSTNDAELLRDAHECVQELCFTAAAPAPLSLAGGEVDPQSVTLEWVKVETRALEEWRAEFGDYVALVTLGHDNVWAHRVNNSGRMGYKSADEAKAAALADLQGRLSIRLHAARKTIALYDAALSPEAPARDETVYHAVPLETRGPAEDARRYREHEERFGKQKALTPRHEAPADPCFECGSTERIGTACKPCNPELHEAPAEGAGEREEIARLRIIATPPGKGLYDAYGFSASRHMADLQALLSDYDALRARSSAPEAREGDHPVEPDVVIEVTEHVHPSLGVTYGSITGWTNKARLPAGRHDLYTHPAAPSADKLREVVEGFVSDLTGGHPKARASRLVISHDALSKRIDQALAALKAEGA